MVSLNNCRTETNYIFISELIVAVGSWVSSSNYNRKAELLDVEENNWSEADDYLFAWGLT